MAAAAEEPRVVAHIDLSDVPDEEPQQQRASQSSSSSQATRQRLSRSNASWMKIKTTPLPYTIKTVYREINLGKLDPPFSDKVMCAKDIEPYTEPIGKYLIRRGFPLIGHGSATLAFLLTEDLVARVALYAYGSVIGNDGLANDTLTKKHYYERTRDIAMHTLYPTCYAYSTVMMFVADGQVYEVFVQERLYGPFVHVGLDHHVLSNDENGFMLEKMVWHNEDVKQFAHTRVKRMFTPVAMDAETGEAIEIELERSWLVGYDFS